MVSKNRYVWIIVLLMGVVIGSFLGEISSKISILQWLSYGETFSIGTVKNPILLDFGIFTFSFYLSIKMSISSIIGFILSIFIYKKI